MHTQRLLPTDVPAADRSRETRLFEQSSGENIRSAIMVAQECSVQSQLSNILLAFYSKGGHWTSTKVLSSEKLYSNSKTLHFKIQIAKLQKCHKNALVSASQPIQHLIPRLLKCTWFVPPVAEIHGAKATLSQHMGPPCTRNEPPVRSIA